MAVTLQIHSNTFKNHKLLQRIKNKRLLSFIGSRFRAKHALEGAFIWQSGVKIEDLYIIVTGSAAFVKPKYNTSIFGAVNGDPKGLYSLCPNLTVTHIGYEDSVVNHIMLIEQLKLQEANKEE